MKKNLLGLLTSFICLVIPFIGLAQSAPNLRSTSSFSLFTGAGAFSNIGASTVVVGDVGTNVGAFSAFPPGVLVGQIHVADPASAQAATDVNLAYGELSTVTCGSVISTTMGGGQTLLPNVYCLGAASTINGDLILDGQGDPNSLFIFKIDGALSTTVNSRVILTNGASICNVYWQVNGQVELGDNSLFQGTIVGNGAILILEGATLNGRGLTMAGEIALHNNVVTISAQPTASTITANGPTTFCTGGSVTLSGNNGGTWSTGSTESSIVVTTPGSYSVTNTNGCGSVISNVIVVTVNPQPATPVITAEGPTTFCEGGSVVLSGNDGGTWSTGSTAATITVTEAGDYFVTNTNGCGTATSNHIIVTVSPAPVASVITAGGATSFCTGGSVVLSGNDGGTWSTGETTGSITVTASGDYYVSTTNACGTVTSNHIVVTVNPLPECNITGSSSICEGQSTQLCVPAGAASYLWSTGATTNCITVSAAGTYTVTITNDAGCSSTCSITVTVTQTPTCTITGSTTICEGQSTQLCVPAGATSYLWSTGATTNCITVSAAGTYSVTVTSAGGCVSTCSATVTVTQPTPCTITGSTTICEGQSTQLCVPAGAASYLWSTGATTNCITVSAAGTYTVTVTSEGGCVSTCSATVTVSQIATCNITGNTTICEGQSTQLCVPAGATSYLWSTGATTNCITVSAAGTYSVTVTSEGGCVSTCSVTVTVTQPTPCTITGSTTICEGQSTQLCVPAGAASYLWSTGATTNCITVSAAGTYTVTVTSEGGCVSTCSATVTVSQIATCNITGNTTICEGQSTQLCVPAGAASYLWSTGATTNCITVSAAGTYSVTVTSEGGCVSTCNVTVTVTQPTPCTITGSPTICQGQSTQLCVPAGAASYLWSTGATTNCITVSEAGTYSVTVTSEGGCVSTCSKTVTVSQAMTCDITGSSTICPGQSTQLCVPAGAASYLWSTGATTNCITVSAAGTYSVTVTSEGGCVSTCSKTVTVGQGVPCTITGKSVICPGQSTQLCVPAGAASYLWSTGATTNCITVTAGGTYSVTVTSEGGCVSTCSKKVLVIPVLPCIITGNPTICLGQSTQLCAPYGSLKYVWSTGATTRCITVTTAGTYTLTTTSIGGCVSTCSKTVTVVPAVPCKITGNSVICLGQSTQLCAPEGCIKYLWSTGATTRCITVTTAGTYTLTTTSAGGCVSTCSKTVTVVPPAPCTITGNSVICLGQSTQLCAPEGCVKYLWSTGATTRCITVTTAGTYTLTTTNAGGCVSTCSKTVTVVPPVPCKITGNPVICLGQSTQLCAPEGCIKYLWSTGATTRCITVTTPGTYTLTTTSAGGCVSTCSKTVTVVPPVPCTITGNSVICKGQSTQLCAPDGCAKYVWSTGATTRCITVTRAGTYTLTTTSAGGCVTTCSKTVTVVPPVPCAITGKSVICKGESTQLCAPEGCMKYVWSTGATTRCITVTRAGTYTLTSTSAGGCVTTCSKTVTVVQPVLCKITGKSVICKGESTQLCAPEGCVKYVWSTGATTRCITVTRAGTYTLTSTNAGGCVTTCSMTVTVVPPVPCKITGKSVICKGESTQLFAPEGCVRYVWSTGARTRSIIVTRAGTYTLTSTNAGGCVTTCSKTVTVVQPISCSITGNTSICQGQSTQLSAPEGCAKYVWSTGARTRSITVTRAGTYTLTTTNAAGCVSTCSKTVTVSQGIPCAITGNATICQGQATQLFAPEGCAKYVWSTGARTRSITVTRAGTYTLTTTNAGGCVSTCSKTVTVSQGVPCAITGNTAICKGQSTQLCAPEGCARYAWSTGATTRCITVSRAGTYTLTITSAGGCVSTCSKTVTETDQPICIITGPTNCNQGGSIKLYAPAGYSKYEWNTGSSSSYITVTRPGTYTVTVYNAGGCKSTASKSVSMSYSNGYNSRTITSAQLPAKTLPAEGSIETRILSKAYPNPFMGRTFIEFQNAGEDAHLKVELFNSSGIRISTLFDREVKANVWYKTEVNGANLSAGTYIYRITNGTQVISEKLILMK